MEKSEIKKRRTGKACERCRLKKIKCDIAGDGHSTCSPCLKANRPCIPSVVDGRSLRSNTSQLHQEIRRKDQIISEVKKQLIQVNQLLNLESKESCETITTRLPVLKENEVVTNRLSSESLDKYSATAASFHGHTSVFNTDIIKENDTNNTVYELNALMSDASIVQSIKLFFKWLYPDVHFFIFRESFLLDFFHPKTQSSFCSASLVYSLAAIGSKLDPNLFHNSESYYKEARKRALENIDEPSITTCQTFMLLGVYEIYNGKNNSAWIFTGNGIRMGFALGFHVDPKSWNIPLNKTTEFELEIRSRFFWGTYVLDHLISMLMGRPSTLCKIQSSMKEPESMPDLKGIGDFNFQGELPIDIENIMKNLINLFEIGDNMITDIFSQGPLFKEFDLDDKLKKLDLFNNEIFDWKESLPENLNWRSEDDLVEMSVNPTLTTIIYIYYITLICLNRPFFKTHLQSSEICLESIINLHKCVTTFMNIHSAEKSSVLIIYSCFISLSVILLNNGDPAYQGENMKEMFFDFIEALQKCGKIWNLAQKSYINIKSKLLSGNFDYEAELAKYKSKDQSVNATQLDVNFMGEETMFEDIFGGPPLFMTAEAIDVWTNTLLNGHE